MKRVSQGFIAATLFRVSRWACGTGVVAVVIAMLLYPGGALHDPFTRAYSLRQNFLSDLGMTVTHAGHANVAGAAVFIAGFGSCAVAFLCCAAGFGVLHAASPRARIPAQLGALGIVLVGLALIGAALSPPDRLHAMHMRFATMASTIGPLALALLAVAAAVDERLPRYVAAVWVLTAFTALGWWAMRWLPVPTAGMGLTVQGVQKVVGVVFVSANGFLAVRGGTVAQVLSAEDADPTW